MKTFFYQSGLDIFKMGPLFFLSGLKAKFRSNTIFDVDVPNIGKVCIRAGDSDFDSVRQVFRGEEYAIVIDDVRDRVWSEYERILAAGKTPVVIDAGANIGAASMWFAKQYPEAAVLAIEPDKDNAKIARRNAENSPNINVFEAAIGGEAGFVSVIREGQSWGVQTARADVGLRVVTIQEAAQTVPNGELFIVKVDIEGFEKDLFASNTEWIDQAFAIYLEPHDWLFPGKKTSRNFQKELAKRDFELFINRENLIFVR